MIHLLRSRATPEQMKEMLEIWETTVRYLGRILSP